MSSSSSSSASSLEYYVDAGANLLDPMYQGSYRSRTHHEPDLDVVLRRAYDAGVRKVVGLAGRI
jgi:TatD DNase family protein